MPRPTRFTGKAWVAAPVHPARRLGAPRALGHDPELLAKATPNYELGCKRVLFTSDWYPTLLRDDVELETGAIERGPQTA